MLRPPGTERRRQDHHRGNPRGPERAHGRPRRGPGDAVGPGRESAAAAARRLAAGDAPSRQAHRGGEPAHVPLVLPAGATHRGGARAGGPLRQARLLDRAALRRAEAAARGRLRLGQRPGTALPRRADHGARSAVPAAALGRRAGFQVARQDGAAHHALHGRGRAALRPRGDRGQGQSDRPGDSPRAHRLAGCPAGGGVRHGAAARARWLGRTSFRPQRAAQRGRDRAHRRAAPRRAAGDPRARGAAGTDPSVDPSGKPGRRLRPPHRKAPARVNAPTAGLKSAPISPALWELTLARLRLFFREPGAVFWTFGFPLLLSIALGIAFRNRPAEPVPVAVVSADLERSLEADPQLRPRLLGESEAREALRTGKVDLVVLAGPPIAYLYDPARAESRLARALADAALHPRGAPATIDRPITEPGSRYIDFLIPGLLGMNLMSAGMWGIGYIVVEMRTKKLLKRLVATPMSRAQFLWSFVVMRALFLLLEMPVLLGFARLVFGVRIVGSIALLLGVSLIGALAFAGIGLLVAARAQNTQTVTGLINL